MAIPAIITALGRVFDENKKKRAKVPRFFQSFQTGEEIELNSETYNIDKVAANREIAIQVVPGQGRTLNDYGDFKTDEFPIPGYDEPASVNIWDGYTRNPGENPINAGEIQARVITKAKNAFPKLVKKIERAKELQSAQAIINGAVTLDVSIGGQVSVDYQRDTNLEITVGTAWSNPASDIEGDVETACENLVNYGFSDPKMIVMSSTNFKYFKNNTAIQKSLDLLHVDVGSIIRPQLKENGGVYRGTYAFGSHNLEIWTNDTIYEVNGVKTRYLPVDRVAIIDPDMDFYTVYAAIPMWVRNDAFSAFGATGLNIPVKGKEKQYIIPDPNGTSNIVGVKSRPLAVLPDVNSVAVLDTTP